jgi:hypothetical protein
MGSRLSIQRSLDSGICRDELSQLGNAAIAPRKVWLLEAVVAVFVIYCDEEEKFK